MAAARDGKPRIDLRHSAQAQTLSIVRRHRPQKVSRDDCGLLRVGRDHYSLKWASRGTRRRARQKATRADAKTEPPPRAAVAGGRARVYDACVRRTSSRVTRGEAQPRVARVPSRVTRHRGVCTRSTRVRGAPTLASVAKRSTEPVTETSGMDVRGKTVLVVGLGCVPVASSQARFSKRPTQPPRRHDARMFSRRGGRDVGTSERERRRDRASRSPPGKLSLTRILLRPLHRLAQEERRRGGVFGPRARRERGGRGRQPGKRGGWRRTPTRRRPASAARAGKPSRTDLGPHETHAGSFVEADVIILSPASP